MIGVLVMASGGPNALDEVEPYLLDVRGGRPTSAEIIHEVRERYRQIGGRSPILERTRAQAAALEAALTEGGQRNQAFVGMRHWHPFIADTLNEMSAAGLRRAVGLVMAPHYSRMSFGAYYKKVDEAHSPLQVARIERWHPLPRCPEALAERVWVGLCRFPAGEPVHVIFTAHRLPQRILEWGDQYLDELRANMAAVLERLRPTAPTTEFAYQSAAKTPTRGWGRMRVRSLRGWGARAAETCSAPPSATCASTSRFYMTLMWYSAGRRRAWACD